jgi:hypothetical protein
MPALDRLLNNHVLCRELRGEQARTGLLKLTHHSIDTRFVAYSERLHIDTEHPIFLRTEHNDVVSLYGNVSSGPGRRWRNSDVPLTTEFQEITSNLAIIGDQAWNESDHVVVATFDLCGADHIFQNSDALRRLSQSTAFETIPRAPLLTATSPRYTASIRYKFSYAFDREAVSDIAPFVHVQFEDPTSIYEYYDAVMCLAQFAACATGVAPAVQTVELYQRAWAPHDADPSAHPAPYFAHYPRAPDYLAEQNQPPGISVWHAHRSESLDALQRALTEWIQRYDQWRAATAMMMGAIHSRAVLSADRIVNACRWLESLPNATPSPSIDVSSIESISAAARGRAAELGYTSLGRRIDGALKRIGTENHAERFVRLVGSLNSSFGGPIAGDRLVDDLSSAINFRNKCAHGNFLPASEEEERAFQRSTLAMEAFCFLLTLKDLHFDPMETHRIENHRIVRDYRLCP